MGKRSTFDINEGMTLADHLRIGIQAKAFCTRCKLDLLIDIPALIEKVGPDYSLYNRRSRCKVPGCDGWNRFHCNRGAVFLPMWSDRQADRWVTIDRDRAA